MTPAEAIQVDVVIDNYNYGRYVRQAVDSALAQTHANVRVVVVDDGSTDGSPAVLERYADRVELVLKENGGQASALNAGLARCSGDVVIFLDADDALDPTAAAQVAEVFARHCEVVHVPYRLEVIDGSGRKNGLVKPSLDMDLPRGQIADAKLVFPFDIVSVGTSGNAWPMRYAGSGPSRRTTRRLRRLVPRAPAAPPWSRPPRGRGPRPLWVPRGEHLRAVRGTGRPPPRPSDDPLREGDNEALEREAREVGLPLPYHPILSVSDLANRLISLRLDRAGHPRAEDTVSRLVRDGSRAARRRWDSPPTMKGLFILWFALTAVAPRPVLERLALAFLFRERRNLLNRCFSRLRRRRRLGVGVGLEHLV